MNAIQPITPAASVYFIRSGRGGPIKIGVSRDPARRLAQLQCGSVTKLTLLGVVPGGFADEAAIHRRLHAYRIHGEHFEAAPEVLEFIAALFREHADALEAEAISDEAA